MAALLLSGCSSLRPTRDLSVRIAKGPPPTTVASTEPTAPPPSPAKDAEAAGSAVSTDQAGPALSAEAPSAGAPKQEPASLSQPAAEPSSWQGMVRDLSTILKSRSGSGNASAVAPDPSDPASAAGAVRSNDNPLARLRLDPPKEETSELPAGEPVAAPPGFAPITLNLQDADARDALQMLGTNASVNVFVASGVSGTVTANLRGMSFEESLDVILRLCNLVAHREGNAIFVYPPGDFPQLDRAIKVIPLDYASATDVVASISAMKGLLSPAGSVSSFIMDDPTKAGGEDAEASDNRKTQEAIVVEDAPEHVFRVERYVQEIDLPPRQVQIQAYILQVELKDNLEHGVNFEEIIRISGNTATLQTVGFANPKAAQAFFARIDGRNFDALLQALKTTTDAKTLAQPKVTVLSGQLAHIQIGKRLGYLDMTTQTETASTQSVKFLELGVVLDVTPRITAADQVVMTVKPKISDGRINPATELPEEETTEVLTNVMLENGQGMVIGGLIKEKDSDVQNKIPYLGDLPYLGMLFQSRTKEAERSEIIIAMLPRVLPYAACPAARDRLETIRATTPLFHGPMRRCPRPWEPTLRDALPNRGDRL